MLFFSSNCNDKISESSENTSIDLFFNTLDPLFKSPNLMRILSSESFFS